MKKVDKVKKHKLPVIKTAPGSKVQPKKYSQ